jgi:hypothetical protein
MNHPELAAAAAELAAQGIPVFPCSEDKKPAVAHGYKDAVSSPDKARRLFLNCRAAALIGMPTGPPSGISVIDVDPQGMDWYARKLRRLPETRVHRTRRGGYHFLYKHPAGLRNSTSVISFGVDVRGDGGYIIIPPSAGYELINEVDIEPFPRWVLALLTRKAKKKQQARADVIVSGDVKPLERFVLHSREGERNQRLFWAACRLGEGGRSAEAEALVSAGLAVGLNEIETRLTVRSGIARGGGGVGPRA